MLSTLALGLLFQSAAATPPRIIVYVASEAVDVVSRVRFGPEGAVVEKVIKVDPRPSEADGPHNLNISPDGKYWYTSVAHGTPNGSLWKFDTANDSLVGKAMLSRFPATISFSPDGEFAWVANFNLFGDMVPSSVSVVYTPAMEEVARIPTCLMPHGMRVARDGSRAWMTCMMDDKLVEMDPGNYGITRVLSVKTGERARDEYIECHDARGEGPRARYHVPRCSRVRDQRQLCAHVGAAVGGWPTALCRL